MKIALIIFRIGPSHGSILQTYALTRKLESMGHCVTIINRRRPIKLRDYTMCLRRVLKNTLKGNFSFSDFYLGSYPDMVMNQLNLFVDEQLKPQMITVTSEKKLREIGLSDYDAFVVGSDQTWRPKYVYNVYNYYLDFVPRDRVVKRIAYAPSFGTSDWEYTKEQEDKCRQLVSLFNGISVREDDGVKLCKEHYGINAELVLDPTLLLTGQDYMRFVHQTPRDRYVGFNFLDFSESKLLAVQSTSCITGFPTRQLISMGDKSKPANERIAPAIEDWLSGIANSELVLVDSFHATVFCILFRRNFITIGNKERGLSRFTSLLKIVGLEERLITEGDKVSEDIINSSIDWDQVENKLKSKRANSMEFLLKLLA